MSSVRVPGNILLFGEYAVLDEGGLGIAAAAAPHAGGSLTECSSFRIRASYGGDATEREAERLCEIDSAGDLLSRVVRSLHGRLLERCGIDIGSMTGELSIDTDQFYDGARKLGFGSSAAASVAAVVLLAGRVGIGRRGAGHTGSGLDPAAELAALCVECYRDAQGGGSGYDVLASLFGGIGLFVGGAEPAWTPLSGRWLPEARLLRGASPVSTGSAVARYRDWAKQHPQKAERFIQSSNRYIQRIASCGSWSQAVGPAREAAELSRRLGTEVGVPAEPVSGTEAATGAAGTVAKCVGAGDELTLVLGRAEGGDDSGTPDSGTGARLLRIDWEGIAWAE